jgi:hypothetical protein
MTKTLAGGAVLALVLTGAVGLTACQKAANNTAETPAAIATNTPPAASAAAPASSDADDAKAFLESLYTHYKTSKDDTFQPFDGSASEVLDPDTLALMKADAKALKGELGDIDGDWLCDCQDFTSIKATIAVQSATPTTAKATSDFKDVDDTSPKLRHDTFDLVKTPAGWRIHDMGTEDQPSLRKVLQDEIAKLKAGGKPTGGAD